MRIRQRLATLAVTFASLWQLSMTQSGAATIYKDLSTGIIFDTWSTSSGMTLGLAIPQNGLSTDATEFIGILKCSSPSGQGTGWCGMSLGGSMTRNLLLMAYPNTSAILTQFMYATGYDMPAKYTGNARLTQVSSSITSDGYSIIFRCQNCLQWNQNGDTGSVSTSSGLLVLGWVHSYSSPLNPSCPDNISLVQHDYQGIFGAPLDSNVSNPSYSSWAALATKTITGSCGGSTSSSSSSSSSTVPTSTSSTTGPTGVPVPTGSYDYIIVGAGAGGIPLADKLSESGKKVLLIEKGPPSSGRWGGDRKPDWLQVTNLTRFDVPGLCNEIWHDSSGIACTDMDQMAGCVLGGGTAVNAGLWWKPNPQDWDYNFPSGWKSSDMSAATSRVFSRISGSTVPSMDGKAYLQQGYDVVSGGLKSAGWAQVDPYNNPDRKNRTYMHTPYMFSNAERGGPMATYLVSANGRSNFKLWMKTAVRRIVRKSGHVTGVEVEPYLAGGYSGTVNLTPVTGRVILSAGTFGSAKILLRSGIGPSDQLKVVSNSADGPTMISGDQWITLPVGYNLEDHTNTDTVITHPSVQFYDFYEAYDNPITSDKNSYLQKRSGILAQAAPNIGPLFFEEIKGSDGIVRQLQWTARVEGSLEVNDTKAITMSQYLGRGAVSRGRMTITSSLNTAVSTVPYLRDQNDIEAVIKGIENLQNALKNVQGLQFVQPPPGTSARDFVNNMVVSPSNRRANHWIGTNKLGTDDGRNGGSAVVDTNTKVWGTDNLFVVDASIFPGMVTTNPSAYIVVAAEHAAQKILALSPATEQVQYAQCGGQTWNGSFLCKGPYTCQYQNPYYSQCL